MIAEIGIALGMRFETPPIILDHEHGPIEDLMHRETHRLSLELQERYLKFPSPYLKLFPKGMGETRRGVRK